MLCIGVFDEYYEYDVVRILMFEIILNIAISL